MAGLLQFTQWQINALIELETAFERCANQGLEFVGWRDLEREGLIDLRAFRGASPTGERREGYWVQSEIVDKC